MPRNDFLGKTMPCPQISSFLYQKRILWIDERQNRLSVCRNLTLSGHSIRYRQKSTCLILRYFLQHFERLYCSSESIHIFVQAFTYASFVLKMNVFVLSVRFFLQKIIEPFSITHMPESFGARKGHEDYRIFVGSEQLLARDHFTRLSKQN